MSETFVNGSAVALLAFLFLLNLTQVVGLVTNRLRSKNSSQKDSWALKIESLIGILDQLS